MRKQTIWLLGAATVLFTAAGLSMAADAKAGKELHDARCLSCHGNDVYTSAQRKVKTLDDLKTQVGRCAKATEAGWTDAQVDDVVGYLNEAFFQFK